MSTSVLSVASEILPLVKTGGLADVAGALPGVLKAEGVSVTTLVPGYPAVLAAATGIMFSPVNVPAMETALRRTAELFRTPQDWTRMVAAGMATDVSWRGPARRTANLYRDLLKTPLPSPVPAGASA